MSEIRELKATPRTRVGKGSARATRREGKLPCVVYGENKPPQAIAVDAHIVTQQIHTGHFLTTLIDINIDGETTRAIPRDIQLDPVRDFPLHVDFLRLAPDSKIAVEIPVHFINEEDSPGLKRGGVLNIVRHEIELECPATAIPDEIVIDLTGLELGDSVHISSVTLPDGAVPTITDRDFTIATIAAPAGMPSDEDEEGEGEEGDEDIEGAEGEETEGEGDGGAEDE